MTPEPVRTSTPSGRALLAVTLFLFAFGCSPAAIMAAADPPFGELGPPNPETRVGHGTPTDTGLLLAAPADVEPDGPRPQSDEARAAAYQETLDAARRHKAADRAKYPRGHSHRHRGHRGHRFSVGKFALVAIVGIAVLRLMIAGRKPATPPPTLRPPTTSTAPAAPAAPAASREIISLACGRCDRVLDLPRDRARRRLFCPRCGAVMPPAEA